MASLTLLDSIQAEMAALDALILEHLHSDVAVIAALGQHIIRGGGKRLRPALAILSGRALGAPAAQVVQLAAVVEFIHTATLLHDDVVDNSALRRGRLTANALWGNAASVLTGDFLYSRAFQLMVDLGRLDVLRILADTTNCIAEGEVMQLMLSHQAHVGEDTHMEVVRRKTAVLFAAAVQCGCLLGGADPARAEALGAYGEALGIAFQLADDCLDYTAQAGEIGKAPGDDLAEGKYTLPLIHALRRVDTARRDALVQRITSGGREAWDEVVALIAETDGISYTARRAEEAAARAIAIADGFPDSPERGILQDLAHYAARRRY